MKRSIRTASPAVLCLAGVMICAAAAYAAATDPTNLPDPTVPEPLRVPAGEHLLLAVRGVGVQIYRCAASAEAPSGFAWTLKAPEAALQNGPNTSWGRHYAGPTWEAADGSKVVGEVVAKADAPDAASIPWLLLRAKSTSGQGVLSGVSSIQRLNTNGGKALLNGCDGTHAGDETRVPYTAEYRFYTAKP